MVKAELAGVPAAVSVRRMTLLGEIRDFFGDKRFIAGTVVGLALLAGGYAISADGGGGGGPSADPGSQLLSDQQSVITEQMRKDAQACAKGDKEGTVGNAINMSLKIHLEMATAMPNVEQLFDVNADCFSGLSSLIDLSFAIPSLAVIISAAQNAVMAYAKKKICSAVSKVTGMVTGPINQAIGQANQYIGALNGLSASLNSGAGLAMLDPNLGAAYNIGQSGNYTTGQPFGDKAQNGVGDSTGGTGGGDQGAGNYTKVQQLTQQLGQMQASLGPAQQSLGQAQQAYNNCMATSGVGGGSAACSSAAAAVDAAQRNVENVQNQITGLQNQINSLLSQGGTASAPGAAATFAVSPAGTAVQPQQQNQSLTQKLTNLFQ